MNVNLLKSHFPKSCHKASKLNLNNSFSDKFDVEILDNKRLS